jgi:hypothetical protein
MTYLHRFILVCALLCGSLTVFADTSPTAFIANNSRASALVVVAHLGSSTPRWFITPYGDHLIISRASLGVEEVLKGSVNRQLYLDSEGGTLDGVTMATSHTPYLPNGFRGVFFLDASNTAVHVPHNKGQGILPLDAADQIRGTHLHLNDIRTIVRTTGH